MGDAGRNDTASSATAAAADMGARHALAVSKAAAGRRMRNVRTTG